MPRVTFQGGGHKTVKPKAPKKPKTSKAKKAKGKKPKKAKVLKPKAFSEQAGAGTQSNVSGAGAGDPWHGVGSTAGASPRPVMELSGLDSATLEGLGGAILDLVGEGKLSVTHALAAWTREQDRVANRAWRRPGGLQRMGGL